MNSRTAEPELMEREVPNDSTQLTAAVRAEIDGAVATARAFPRSMTNFRREAFELVSTDEETAEACIYSLPRGKNDDGTKKFITGPSARFAEILAYAFGNNRSGGRVASNEGNYIIAQGSFHDLEKNVQITMEVPRRITDKHGRRFNDDMIGVTGNAAASIAHRNAVLKVIPKALWLPIYLAARKVAVGDMSTLAQRKANYLAWFVKVGVTEEMLCAKLDVPGVADIGLEELEVLAGLRTAIKDGTSTDQLFGPEPSSKVGVATDRGNVKDLDEKLRSRGTSAKAKPESTKQPSAFDKHVSAMTAAATVDALAEAYEATNDPDSTLTEAERAELVDLYGRREAALKDAT